MLKVNDNKTEFMLVTSKRTKRQQNLSTSITIINIKKFQHLKTLGFTLECHLTVNEHDAYIAEHASSNYIVWHLSVDS